jgi:P-type conjugative transfer protein TrbJ
MRRLGLFAAVGTIALTLCATVPARAQWIVFDPNNYVQNVLTAARELQQISNQITSLQNEAQMLINQARNLASLPYSSLQQLQSSIQRTQQLLAQAQRIAYDVQQIDRAFSTSYAPASGNQSSQLLITNAQSRWQNSVAALQDALRVQAGVVGNLDTNRVQTSALCRRPRPAIRSSRFRRSNSPISPPLSRHRAGHRALKRRSARQLKTRAVNSSGGF